MVCRSAVKFNRQSLEHLESGRHAEKPIEMHRMIKRIMKASSSGTQLLEGAFPVEVPRSYVEYINIRR